MIEICHIIYLSPIKTLIKTFILRLLNIIKNGSS